MGDRGATHASGPDPDEDDKAKSDFWSERSTDAAVITAWVAPNHSITFALTPEAQRLADRIQPLAQAVLGLRESVTAYERQKAELARVWKTVRGLSAVVAMHQAYNQQCNLVPHGGAELMDATTKLLDRCSKSPAFPSTNGDICSVNVLPINAKLRREAGSHIRDISHYLNEDAELRAAYEALTKTKDTNPNLAIEMRIAHLIVAEAHEVVQKAHFIAPDDSSKAAVANMGAMIESLIEMPAKSRAEDPGTNSILDVMIPAWARMMLAKSTAFARAAASVAAPAAPWIGPDFILLKLAICYLNRKIPKLIMDRSQAKAVRDFVLGCVNEAMGAASAEAAYDELLDRAHQFNTAQSRLVLAKATPGVTAGELAKLEREVSNASAEHDKAMNEFKTGLFEEKSRPWDGRLANLVLAVIAGLQTIDAICSFLEALERHSLKDEIKSGADLAGGALQTAGSALGLYVRIKNLETPSWGTIAVSRLFGAGAAVANVVSGAAQVAGASESGKTSDYLIGGLNVVSGGSLLIFYTVGQSLYFLPAVGQVCAFLAFATSLELQILEDEAPMTGRFVKATIDTLKNAWWQHGDPPIGSDNGDQGPLAEVLGFRAELEVLSEAAKHADFYRIPAPPGLTRESIVQTLIEYTGSSENAEDMVMNW